MRLAEFRPGVALLSAGSSRRFGEADKLAQTFRGKHLGEHAANALPMTRFSHAWVITSLPNHPCEPAWRGVGLEPVINREAELGMGTSVALAARLAQQSGCDALLIALADMPIVPQTHFEALVDGVNSAEDILTSANGATRMPPAVFGSDHFAQLAALSGDRGARDLLAKGRIISCPADWLIDIDTPEALQKHGQA